MKHPEQYLLAVPVTMIVLALFGGAIGDEIAKRSVNPEHSVTIQDIEKDVHDADTFYCDIDLDFGVVLKHQQVRCCDFDAWEVSRVRRTVDITEEELERGRQARDELRALFRQAAAITVESQRPVRDSYGRLLVKVRVDGKLLSEWIEHHGFSRGSKPKKKKVKVTTSHEESYRHAENTWAIPYKDWPDEEKAPEDRANQRDAVGDYDIPAGD